MTRDDLIPDLASSPDSAPETARGREMIDDLQSDAARDGIHDGGQCRSGDHTPAATVDPGPGGHGIRGDPQGSAPRPELGDNGGHTSSEARVSLATDHIGAGRPEHDTHSVFARATGDTAAIRHADTPGALAADHHTAAGQIDLDAHGDNAGSDVAREGRATTDSAPNSFTPAPSLADAMLLYYAALVDDAERARIAAENRLRTMTAPVDEHGHGLAPELPEVQLAQATLDELAAFEAGLVKSLERAMRSHPLGPWVASAKGVGMKTAARLLHLIGDPAWHTKEQRPRTVSELWAYCGLGVIDGRAQRLVRGQKANWSTEAKKRAFIIADSCIKHRCGPCRDAVKADRAVAVDDGSYAPPPRDCTCAETHPYRHVYDAARAQYLDRTDADSEPLTPIHQHRMAMRRVMKRLLRDMWRASRRAHGWVDEEQIAA